MFERVFLVALMVYLVIGNEFVPCTPTEVPIDVLKSITNSVSGLQTGRIQVVNIGSNQRYTKFSRTLTKSIFDYSLSVAIKNINSFSPKNGLDFQITAVPYDTFFVGYLIMNIQTKWLKMVICYIASSRSDFIVGNFIVGTSQIYKENSNLVNPQFNQQNVTFSYNVPIQRPMTPREHHAMPFVSGLRTFDQKLAFTFVHSHFNTTSHQLECKISIQYQKYPLQFLAISYLIFHMANQLEVTKLFDTSRVPQGVDAFMGVTQVDSSTIKFNKVDSTVSRPLLQVGPATLQAFDQMFGLNGILVQTQQSLEILFKAIEINQANQAAALTCISKSHCLRLNGVLVSSQVSVYDISSICYICKQNSIYKLSVKKCQCKPNYHFQNGNCISTCGSHQIYSVTMKRCICDQLFVNITGVCMSIFSRCTPQQIYYNGRCIQVVINQNDLPCPLNFIKISGKCQQRKICSQHQILSISTNECACPGQTVMVDGKCQNCSQNSTMVDQKCTCKQGFFLIEGKCLKCGPLGYFNGQQCVCHRNYEGDGFDCIINASFQGSLSSSALSGSLVPPPGGAIPINNRN